MPNHPQRSAPLRRGRLPLYPLAHPRIESVRFTGGAALLAAVATALMLGANACSGSAPATGAEDAGGVDGSGAGFGSPKDGSSGVSNADVVVGSTNDATTGSSDGASAPDDAGDDAPGPSSGNDAADDAASSGDAFVGTTVSMEVTSYGWADNSPPGNAIAYPANGGYPTIHNAAGGTGTYADPITFATDKDEYPPGTILYVPFLEKYVIMEDDCTQCDSDWNSSMMRHIDVWMNSNGTESSSALIACEDSWTQSAAEVATSPGPNLTVTTAPLFDPSTNMCRTSP
jgi:hypothetical protein